MLHPLSVNVQVLYSIIIYIYSHVIRHKVLTFVICV